jgi:hypothetical protein
MAGPGLLHRPGILQIGVRTAAAKQRTNLHGTHALVSHNCCPRQSSVPQQQVLLIRLCCPPAGAQVMYQSRIPVYCRTELTFVLDTWLVLGTHLSALSTAPLPAPPAAAQAVGAVMLPSCATTNHWPLARTHQLRVGLRHQDLPAPPCPI